MTRKRQSLADWSHEDRLKVRKLLSNFPPGAIDAITEQVRKLRISQTVDRHRLRKTEIRDELFKIHKAAKEFAKGISCIGVDQLDSMFDAAQVDAKRPDEELVQRPYLVTTVKDILWIADLVILTLSQMRVKRGPQSGGGGYFMTLLLAAAIEKYAGKRIQRSRKSNSLCQLLISLCQIADPSISAGTIDEALRKRNRVRIKMIGGIRQKK
jgi:hypothetical protein